MYTRSLTIMTNPLQKFFRQPKVYVKLPSGGIYSKPGNIQGDLNQLPVYGMTGMDEIVLRTPDALLSGESTANIIHSCIPAIVDPWELSIIDMVPLLSAVRIATYGNEMKVEHRCTNCNEDNDYDIDLNKIIEHYMHLSYNGKIVLRDLVINLQPLNYKQSTEFNLRNFRLQQQIAQAGTVTDEEEQQKLVNNLYKELARIQAEIFLYIIESVETGSERVTERSFISEWLSNCEADVYDAIKGRNVTNNEAWAIPQFPIKCDHCEHESKLSVELDNSNFFAKA